MARRPRIPSRVCGGEKLIIMRILAVHRHFWPDPPPYASFLRSIGGRWAADGHSVEILTAQSSYNAAERAEQRPAKERVDDLDVQRVRVVPEGGLLPGQFLNLLVFPLQVALRILVGPKRDMVMCSTAPQVTLGYAVAIAARIRRTKFVYHCMDLHPEIGRLSGEFANPVVFKILAAMDLATMRRAARIIVLSEDMRATVVSRDLQLASKVEVLNNFSIPEFSEPAESPLPTPAPGTLRIVFTGNLGRFQGLETAVEALGGLSSGSPVELVFMGEGKAKKDLEALAGLRAGRPDVTVTFLPHGSPGAAKALMRTAHLGLVSLVPGVIRYAYPSKTATYAGEGLPLLVACEQDSELARSVRDQGLGLSVPVNDTAAMAEAIEHGRIRLAEDRGQRWRDAVMEKARQEFNEEVVLNKWAALGNGMDEATSLKDKSDVVIIVGAPRSGTNMLRDVLTSLDGFATWPCDEINLMWKHGNLHVPHDELTPVHARPEIITYLRRKFEKLGRRENAHTVVEKTCATSLRVAFTAKIFPEAKYIFVHRDGVDAAPSAMKRWNAPFEVKYTLKKLRWVPRRDWPIHFYKFLVEMFRSSNLGKSGRTDADLAVKSWWGPRPADYTNLQHEHPLDEIATIQWQRCVESSIRDLNQLPSSQVLKVSYEEFVLDPRTGIDRILQFLKCPVGNVEHAITEVSAASVGKGRTQLGDDSAGRLDSLARTTLIKLGYV